MRRTKTATHPERTGRPLAITLPLERDPDGTVTLTTGDRFLQLIAIGNPIRLASRGAGMNTDTVITTLKDGARLSTQIAQGRRSRDLLTADDLARLTFSERYTRASADAFTRLSALVDGHIRGGNVTTSTVSVTRTLANGEQETTHTVRQEIIGPDANMLRWWMSKTMPGMFGDRLTVDTDPHQSDQDVEVDDTDRLAMILDEARQIAAGDQTPGPIDTTATVSR